ncbi:MAG: PBSX family phage terminase large subunit [Ruminococcus sp.]|nr:PBSX family phage terminase large subunit [Ruminococcus sp.]
MEYKPFSKKQMKVLTWWCDSSKYKNCDALICDGAVRSGKTFCMSLSFVIWASSNFDDASFALCGKTIKSLRRNLVTPLISPLKELGFLVEEKYSDNLLIVSYQGRVNRFYLFSGKDEGSASLIQGMTLSGILLDEVALMPRSFVEQALARCSVSGSTFWFNCNPEYPSHWFYNEWIKKQKEKNALYIHFTMKDNPSLTQKMIKRYEKMYSGAFYRRFVKGEWVSVNGAVYPFMEHSKSFVDVPDGEFCDFAVSCDYGTVNPCSIGLWAKQNNVWYRIDEYYFDSKREGFQKTDEEHYKSLCELVGDKKVSKVTVDPSARSFIEVIKRHQRFTVVPAINSVVDGIRMVSSALKEGRIAVCNSCKDSMREFSLYRWNENARNDTVVKENDHAMDDIRYFVSTILNNDNDDFCVVALKRY